MTGFARSAEMPPTVFAAGLFFMMCVPHAFWSNAYGVIAASAALFFVLCRRSAAPGPAVLGKGIWLFLGMCVVSSLRAAHLLSGLRVCVFYLSGTALCFCSAAVFRSEDAAEKLFSAIYAALLLTSVCGLIVWFSGGDAYGVPIGGRILPRLGSMLEHAINYGEFIAMAAPGSLVWAMNRKGRRRSLLLMLLLIPSAALLLTYSRTGWIALGFALVILLPRIPRRCIPVGLILAAAVFFLLPDTVRIRALSMLRWTDASASGRFTLWRECLSMLGEHRLAGVGPGTENFTGAYLPFSGGKLPFVPPHANMGYLQAAVAVGIVGWAGYMLFFFRIFPLLDEAVHVTADSAVRQTLTALKASLAGAALANIPEHIWFYPRILFFWCVLYGAGLGLCGSVLPVSGKPSVYSKK